MSLKGFNTTGMLFRSKFINNEPFVLVDNSVRAIFYPCGYLHPLIQEAYNSKSFVSEWKLTAIIKAAYGLNEDTIKVLSKLEECTHGRGVMKPSLKSKIGTVLINIGCTKIGFKIHKVLLDKYDVRYL